MWTLKIFYFSLLVMFFVIITSQEEKIKPVHYEFVPRGTLALIHKGNLKIEINTEGILSDFEALLQTIEKIAIKTEDLNHRQSLSTLRHQMMKTLKVCIHWNFYVEHGSFVPCWGAIFLAACPEGLQ